MRSLVLCRDSSKTSFLAVDTKTRKFETISLSCSENSKGRFGPCGTHKNEGKTFQKYLRSADRVGFYINVSKVLNILKKPQQEFK